ncbi:FkbM family methyltransferase [Bradyrhizobium symbiodeficiens]|uniref:FkbM family methyltransferase n=1 Tax=Bradyrhizobium symbiodeficiens TaxID=1404367 RepID=UPI00140F8F8E|nr:FkbM family methyltransferase [Bradyrhizobium symbiodeficiens]QIP01741.1 FkbM family methyltransferase [Bradyrhizobium symbiodeficiens]
MISSLRGLAAAVRSIGPRLTHPTMYRASRDSWSQEGEDLILARFMEPRTSGFYVDVGAHDPFRFSNTAYFYRQGWSGLNIEPDPQGARMLRRYRDRDITLNIGIGSAASSMTFFRFNEPALNTFSPELARARTGLNGYSIVEETAVAVDRLDAVLEKHLPAGQQIDFMTVDAEGLDLTVLQSNDWSRFRPDIVVAELLNAPSLDVADQPAVRFMSGAGYRPVAKAANSVFFAVNELSL